LLTCIHGRHELSKLTLNYHEDIALRMFRQRGLSLDRFAVMSPEDEPVMGPVCEDCYVNWKTHPNMPVSLKWQAALDFVRESVGDDVDAVMLINSDDLVTYEYFDHVVDLVESGQSLGFGPDRCWMLDSATGRMGQWQVPTHGRGTGGQIGAARVLTRSLLYRVGWKLWTKEANSGLDAMCRIRLNALGYELDLLGLEPYDARAVVDIKTDVNIWAFDAYDYPLILEPADAEAHLRQIGFEAAAEFCGAMAGKGK